MPALGFTIMKEKLIDGSKRQTIRLLRKHPIKVGDSLFLFWKLRTKECELIRKETCTETFLIQMQYYEVWLDSSKPIWRVDKILPNKGIRTLLDFQVEELAQRDGFTNALEMVRWFKKKHGDLDNKTFQVIRW